jgi:Peptidase family M28
MMAVTLVTAALASAGPLAAQTPLPDLDPRIQALVGSVSEERLRALLEKLVSFGTRNTLSDQTSPTRGIGAARQWIHDELERTSSRLQVSFDTHLLPPGGRVPHEVELRNVLAVLPGKSPRRIYVSGHYDSLNLGERGQAGLNTGGALATADPNWDAPGADDDGSGTALSMELARVFAESGIDFDATLVFMTVAGEEQGLLGARAHAQRMKELKVPVQALFNNDIVGNATGGNGIVDGHSIRLYSAGPEDSPSRSLAQFTRRVAARYVPSHEIRPLARPDRFRRGGDHSAFNAEGFAAVGFRESRENYAKQHNAHDTLDGVSYRYLAQNARANAAAMATLALAPPPPTVNDENGAPMLDRLPSGYDGHLRWTASPGASAYRIYWRNAWAPDWEHDLVVGNVTEHVFPDANIDDQVYGVAAIGPHGHESTINAYVEPARAW